MINKQLSELAMDDMNLSQLNEEELMEIQGGFLGFVTGIVVSFIVTVGFQMGLQDGAKNKHL
jgi:lactobin A/cerein 7B family class IIb bacteriocin